MKKACNSCKVEYDIKHFTNGWAICKKCREVKRKEKVAEEMKTKEEGIYFVHDPYYTQIWKNSK